MKIFFLIVSLTAYTLWGQEIIPPHSIPELVPEESGKFSGAFIKVMLAVGVMVMLLMFLSWTSRKMIASKIQQVNDTSSIKIVETRPISNKTILYQMELEGRTIVFSESTNGVTLLNATPKRELFNLKET